MAPQPGCPGCNTAHFARLAPLVVLSLAWGCKVRAPIVSLETGSNDLDGLETDTGMGAGTEGSEGSSDPTVSTDTLVDPTEGDTQTETETEGNTLEDSGDPERVGLLVAVGHGGLRVRSFDHGQSWVDYEAIDETGEDDRYMRTGICYAEGTFVVTGGGVQTGELLVSRDGLNWTSHKPEAGRFQDCVWTGTEFVAVANDKVYRSNDGDQWQLQAATGIRPNGGSTLCHGPPGFVLVREDVAWWSANANDWQEVETQVERKMTSVFGDGTYVVAGFDGQRSYSKDGKNWTPALEIAGDTAKQMHGIYDGRRFVLSGNDGRLRVSDDGITWRIQGDRAPFGALAYTGVKYVGTSWVDNLHISLDLETWEDVVDLPGEAGLTSIEYGEIEVERRR